MKNMYRTILSSLLSEKEIKEIDDIEKSCKNDIYLYEFLCASGCFLFADWAEGTSFFDEFSSFVKFRLEAFDKFDINFNKTTFLKSLYGQKSKGDTMRLLLKYFKEQIEKMGFFLVDLDFFDDTYRLCITKTSCVKALSNSELMDSKFVII